MTAPKVIATYSMSNGKAKLGTLIGALFPVASLAFFFDSLLRGDYFTASITFAIFVLTGALVFTAIRNVASHLRYDLTEDGLFVEVKRDCQKVHPAADLVQVKATMIGEGTYRIEFKDKKIYWLPPEAQLLVEALAKAGGCQIEHPFAKVPRNPQ